MADEPEILVTFLNSLKIRLKCAICLDVIINAVELCCGHKYCVKCYDGLKENNQQVKCPLCNFVVERRTSHYRDKFWNSLGHFVKAFDDIMNEKCDLTKTYGEQDVNKSKSKSLKEELVKSWLSDSKNVFNRQSQTQDASQSTSCDNQFNLPSVSQLNKPRRSRRQERLHKSLEIEVKKPCSNTKKTSEGAELSKSFTTTIPALSKSQQQFLEDELLEKLVKEIPKSPKKKKEKSEKNVSFLKCSDQKGWKRVKELGKNTMPRSQKQLKVQINKSETVTAKTSQSKESQSKHCQNVEGDLSKDVEIIQNKDVSIEEPNRDTKEKDKTSPFKGNIPQNKSFQQKCSDYSSPSIEKTLHLNAIVAGTESNDYSNANDLSKDLDIIQNKNDDSEESFQVPKEKDRASQSLKGKISQEKSSTQKQSSDSLLTITKSFDLNTGENFISRNMSILTPEPDSSKNKSKEDTILEEDEAFLIPTQRLNIVCKKRESLNEDFDHELNLPTQRIITELENNIVPVECSNIIGMLEIKVKMLQECSKDSFKQVCSEINYCIQQLKKSVNNVEKADVSVQFDTLNYARAAKKVDVGVQFHTEFCVKGTQTNVASKDVYIQVIPHTCEKEAQVNSQTELKPDCQSQNLSKEELKQIFQNSNFNEENNLTNPHIENPIESIKKITNRPNEELFANSWDNLNFNTEDILKDALRKSSQKCIEQALEVDKKQNQAEQSSQLIFTLQSRNKRSRNVEIVPGNCDSDEEIKPVKKKNRFMQEDLSIEIDTCNTQAVNCNNSLNKIDSENQTEEVVEEKPDIWQECDDIINFVNKNISKLAKKSSEKESESDFISETEYPEPVIKRRKVSKLDQAFDKGKPTEYEAVQEFHNSIADEAFEDILIPVAPKINVISDIVIQNPAEEENLFSDDDIVESTPPRIEENDIPCEEINLALPPPPGFEDEEELPSNKENLPQQSQLQADASSFNTPIPNLMLSKKLDHSTPFTQNHQNETLNLSPITLCTQKVLSTPKRSSSRMSIMSSIAGQKSMWNFVKTTKESQDEIKSQQKQKPCLCSTRLNQIQTRVIKELEDKGLITVTNSFNDDVTHLIVKVDAKNRLKEYTLKYIKAITRGIWVLKYEWILECSRKNKIVPEEPYEILDDSGQNGPKMARLKIKTEPLFRNFKFFCCNPFTMTSKEDMEEIIKELGGIVYKKIVDMLENDGKIPLIIVDDQETQNVDTYTRWLELYKIVTVDYNWLTQSVGRYRILSILPFMYCTDECLQELNYPEYLTENMPPTIE